MNPTQPQPQLTTTASAPPTSTVYALLVGVDQYQADLILQGQVRFPALQGCVNDANTVKTYLEQDTALTTDVVLLTNTDASKAAVVQAFRQQLGKAKAGDVALFYFSGHGTQEKADPAIWTTETDGLLECLACYYDAQTANDFLLADKELRYLIREVAEQQPQLVLIFDCCHSGDNTRNGDVVKAAFAGAQEKQIPFTFPPRDWASFIFGADVAADEVVKRGVTALFPEGTHVQLSACESDELAMEVAGAGVFTKTMLTVLRKAGGALSYYSLRSRVRQYLRNVFEQQPRIYVANGDDALLYGNFLNRPGLPDETTTGEVVFNQPQGQPGSWIVNLGAIHGLSTATPPITVTDPQAPQTTYQATIASVQVDNASLAFAGATPPDKQATYQATIAGLMTQPLAITVENNGASLPEQQQLMDGLLAPKAGYIVAQEEAANAQYVVHGQTDYYYITYPNDPYRPLTALVKTGTPTTAAQLLGQLAHIAQWEFRKALSNTSGNRLPDSALNVAFFQPKAGGGLTPLTLENNGVSLHYTAQPDGSYTSSLQIKLTNTTPGNLYCAVLYLSSTFESFLGFLNPTTYLLAAGNEVFLSVTSDQLISTTLPPELQLYNWPQRQEYLKIVFSTTEFDVKALKLPELPKPPTPGVPAGETGLRSILATKPLNLQGWTTQLYTLNIVNPTPGQIAPATLQAMRTDPQTSFFAQALYPDPITT